MSPTVIPTIALTGYLGAGKTTVLNSVLRAPGARFGVVINDFGSIDVDAALITGQVDEAASISGGCLCCLPDSGGLDEALEKLSHPSLQLDAILVEASGVAEPLAVARLIGEASTHRIRPGGVIEVVDACSYLDTVDPVGPSGTRGEPPARFAAASLVVITKTALLPPEQHRSRVEEITARIRLRQPAAPILEAPHGTIDPALVADIAHREEPDGQLPLAEITRQDREERAHHDHVHADVVTVHAAGPVEPGAVLDLLEDPPAGVYRLKGTITVRAPEGDRHCAAQLVGRHLHLTPCSPGGEEGLVAIGPHLDTTSVHSRLTAALRESGTATADGLRRLDRRLRLSDRSRG